MESRQEIRLVVFDWAGTTVDYGSSAPVAVFERVFTEAGIALTREEINGPMGMDKKTHIRSLLSLDTARSQWKEKYGRCWDEEDVERLYAAFEDELYRVAAEYSRPIAGTVEAVEELRKMGIAIGSTTGYTSEMMKQVAPAAEKYGYKPDCIVTPDVTGAGRPTPFMMYECMRRLNVYPPCAVVKAGDTITDIREGKNGGAWSIGILTGSNLLGLTKEEYETMGQEELAQRKEEAKKRYMEAGADMVIDSIRDLPQAIREINRRMQEEKKDECVL